MWAISTAHRKICGRGHGAGQGRDPRHRDPGRGAGLRQTTGDGTDLHRTPSWKELERRLTARGTDTPEKVQKRLLRAQVELKNASDYNYFVINDTVEQAVEELRAILCAEHCKPAERMEYILNGKEM